MVIPERVFVDGWAGGDLAAARQAGRSTMAPEELAAALLDANPDWTAVEPLAAGSDGAMRFEVTGPGESTAIVRIIPEENSAAPDDVVITRWVIDYQ